MKIEAIDVPELGNRSYIVHDGKSAVVIDPSRSTQVIIDKAEQKHLDIKAILETHIHNDYITGGYDLARKLKIPYYVSAHEKVSFERQKINSEQTVSVGGLEITALASSGHTHHHLSYLVTQDDGSTPALFSGGSLLYGAVGRTDLVSDDSTLELAKAQYKTAQFFVDRLDPKTELYPTHGFGSFCAATETEHVGVSTIKQQMKSNQAYISKDEASFVEELLQNLDAYPAYYAYMAPANLKGPLEPKLNTPQRLTREAVMSALHTGSAIVDMRSRLAYASEHLPGTYNIELGNSFATYVGWLFAWESPIILVAANKEEVSIAQAQLSLIGREILAGHISPTDLLKSTDQTLSYPVKTFADLAESINAGEDVAILDVRRKSEWQKAHLTMAQNIPLHELNARLTEVLSNKPVWVHCASGFRSSIAASILSGNGKPVVLIDDQFANAKRSGLNVQKSEKYVSEVETGKVQLLDVRDKDEWDKGHATNAIHIPLAVLVEGINPSLKKDAPLYVYCESGRRSGLAESILKSQGYQAISIGGLNDWTQAGGKLEN